MRCAYHEGRKRCPREGTGNPPLCRPHRIVLEGSPAPKWGDGLRQIAGKLFEGKKPTERDVRRAVQDGIGMLFGDEGGVSDEETKRMLRDLQNLSKKYTTPPPWATGAPPHESWRDAKEPPRQHPPKPKGPDPRIALGFKVGEKVTVEQVNRRRRELARKHHPDRGGSVAQMATINAAADQLLADLATG
jgi:hypothetical protein